MASLLFISCEKELKTDVPSVNFTVTNARQVVDDTFVYHLGDTCRFNIDGYADNITYWAGTSGNEYKYRTRNKALGNILLSFTSQAQYGSETNTLKVFSTTNLPNLDSATVVSASWTDITERTPLSITGNTTVNTDNVNISDLVKNPEDALYIAFKYTSTITSGNRRSWTITNYTVKNVGTDFNSTIGDLTNDATLWTRYGNVWNPASRRWTATASNLKIDGGTQSDPNNESWIISKPMYVGRVNPDIPTATVKTINSTLKDYEYTYNAVGNYKVTFVSYNTTKDETKSEIKQFNIKIIP